MKAYGFKVAEIGRHYFGYCYAEDGTRLGQAASSDEKYLAKDMAPLAEGYEYQYVPQAPQWLLRKIFGEKE